MYAAMPRDVLIGEPVLSRASLFSLGFVGIPLPEPPFRKERYWIPGLNKGQNSKRESLLGLFVIPKG